MPHRAGLVLVLLGLNLLVSCRDSSPPEAESASGQQEVDRLRSLPYQGFGEEPIQGELGGVTRRDSARSYPGYDLYSTRNLCRADLIDEQGNAVNSWHQPGNNWSNCRLLPNGDLLVVGSNVADVPGQIIEDGERYLLRLSWDNKVVWKQKLMAHHDVTSTADGRILTLTLGYRNAPEISRTADVRDDRLTLLDASGNVIETVSLLDAMSGHPERFSFQRVAAQRAAGRVAIDLFHANSVEWLPGGKVLVCIRHQDTVAIIDWRSRTLEWAWGQGQLSGPHDAHMLPDGHVLVFDNGLSRGWSRVLEVEPRGGRIVWEYQSDPPQAFYTRSHGANQRLPNGNTLITESQKGRAFEVTPAKEIVWEYFTPHADNLRHRATIVRMQRYEKEYVEQILASRASP